MDLTQELKQEIIKSYQKYGDEICLLVGNESYTGNELANEIETETCFGKDLIGKVLVLSIDLVKRNKEKLK